MKIASFCFSSTFLTQWTRKGQNIQCYFQLFFTSSRFLCSWRAHISRHLRDVHAEIVKGIERKSWIKKKMKMKEMWVKKSFLFWMRLMILYQFDGMLSFLQLRILWTKHPMRTLIWLFELCKSKVFFTLINREKNDTLRPWSFCCAKQKLGIFFLSCYQSRPFYVFWTVNMGAEHESKRIECSETNASGKSKLLYEFEIWILCKTQGCL